MKASPVDVSGPKQAEPELENRELERAKIESDRKAPEIWRDLYDRAQLGSCTISKQGVIRQINLSASDLFGFDQSDLVGRRLSSFIHKEDRKRYRDFIKAPLKAADPELCEVRMARNNGLLSRVRLSATVLPSTNGRRAHEIRLALTDIVDSETAAVDVRRSEELYRMAFRINPNALSVTRLIDGLFLDVNDEFVRAYGWARDEAIGRTSLDIRIWKRPVERQSLIDAVRRDGYCDNFEADLVARDGKEFSGLVSARLIMLAGEPCMLAITHDITERKRVFNALREQKEFFHLIAENLSDFVAVLDLDGRRVYNSPSYRKFFGALSEMRGSDSFVEVHPEDRERVKQAFSDTVRTGEGRQLEYRLVIPDGTIRTMESRGSVIRDREGRVARVVVVARDITERKQIEEQVHQMAFHDTLTKLPNRRLFNDRLARVVAASLRSGYYGAVMFLDLDNFKQLNDSHGHDVGDLLLIEVAERLKSCVREMDTVARFGGDEFVVMISELARERAESIDGAKLIAEKIRLRLEAPYRLSIKPAEMPEKVVEHSCTASIGLVVFVDHEISQDSILKWADTAMYQAKEGGRNSVRLIDVEAIQGLRPQDVVE